MTPSNEAYDGTEAQQDLDALLNTVPVGVVVFDVATGSPRYFNREMLRIANSLADSDQSPESVLEVLTFRRSDGRETSLSEFPLAQALAAGETVRAEEIVLRVPDGRRITTLVNATPVSAAEGGVATMVVTMQDMTPLEDLARQRAEFVALVGRELRAPVTSIKGAAAAALRADDMRDPGETTQLFHIIDNQADRMLDLISDLTDAARLDAGVLLVSPEPSDVGILVEQARAAFLSTGGRNHVRLDLPPDLPRVMADSRRIVQVLGNLMSNAERRSPESAAIRVGAAAEGLEVAISVTAAGVEVPPEHLRHLFRKFGDPKDGGRLGRGTGLDLAICRGVVESHGGRIRVDSGPNQGIRFTFTLPVEVAVHSPVPSRRPRVLVVDANPAHLHQVRRDLTDTGYAVTAVGEPEQALLLLAEQRPQLVLMSLALPGIDAGTFVQTLLGVADVPVLCLSDAGRDQDIARAFEMGADDYLVRPYSPSELAARMRAALVRRAAVRPNEPSEPYIRGALTIDFARRLVTMDGQPLPLTATEYGLLAELATHAGSALTYEHLLQRVWGWNNPGNPYVVRTHLMRLRRKLGEDGHNPAYILAVPRVGYRMVLPGQG
ncbi:MAG: winged helix-turn-helix domain-containing protein [Caldilineaceae bacterium]|nr:winged helix-turn-helix domain-containing protein [Caldilineaceae bacterium]